jgi:hypothetical protein
MPPLPHAHDLRLQNSHVVDIGHSQINIQGVVHVHQSPRVQGGSSSSPLWASVGPSLCSSRPVRTKPASATSPTRLGHLCQHPAHQRPRLPALDSRTANERHELRRGRYKDRRRRRDHIRRHIQLFIQCLPACQSPAQPSGTSRSRSLVSKRTRRHSQAERSLPRARDCQ